MPPKIIVPLRAKSRTQLYQLMEKIDGRADIVELWLDHFRMSTGMMEQLRKDFSGYQYLGVCKSKAHGGNFEGVIDRKVSMLQDFIAGGGDFVDLDITETPLGEVKKFPHEKLWLSFHDFKATPDNLEEIGAMMTFFDPYLTKFAVTLRSREDGERFMRFAEDFSRGHESIFTTMGSLGEEWRELFATRGVSWGAFYALDTHHRTASGQRVLEASG